MSEVITTERTDSKQSQPRRRRGPAIAVPVLIAIALFPAACGSDESSAGSVDETVPATQQESDTTEPPTDTAPVESIETIMTEILETHHANGEFTGARMAVRDADGATHLATYGTQDVSSDSPAVDIDTPWGIGSATKPMVAVVALQLAEEGLLDLDAGIESYFPDLPNAANITPRQMLQHTSGLEDYLNLPAVQQDAQRKWPPEELVELAVNEGSVFEPGTGFHYSNTGFTLLGEMIEQITSNPWDLEVAERILNPLGMTSTALASDVATGYGLTEEGEFVDHTNRWHPTVGGPAGGLQSNLPDLLLFTEALVDGTLLNEQSQREMATFVPGEDLGWIGHSSGLGFEQYVLNEVTIQGHLGSGAAHSVFIGFDPDTGVAVVTMMNADTSGPQAFMAAELLGAVTNKNAGPPD